MCYAPLHLFFISPSAAAALCSSHEAEEDRSLLTRFCQKQPRWKCVQKQISEECEADVTNTQRQVEEDREKLTTCAWRWKEGTQNKTHMWCNSSEKFIQLALAAAALEYQIDTSTVAISHMNKYKQTKIHSQDVNHLLGLQVKLFKATDKRRFLGLSSILHVVTLYVETISFNLTINYKEMSR